jgi:hypothetical protein
VRDAISQKVPADLARAATDRDCASVPVDNSEDREAFPRRTKKSRAAPDPD